MAKMYHGCRKGHVDGSHFLIKKVKNVLFQPPVVFGKTRTIL